MFAYCATKAIVERFVWDNRGDIDVTAVCLGASIHRLLFELHSEFVIGTIVGPVRHPVRSLEDLNFSNAETFIPIITKKEDDFIPPTPPIINVSLSVFLFQTYGRKYTILELDRRTRHGEAISESR